MSQLVATSPRPSRRTSRAAFSAAPPADDDPLLQFEPYLHKQPRRNAITPDRQRAFIAALDATGIVTQAARSIGASLEALYELRRLAGAEGFAAAWDRAIDLGVARLEDCALQLAIEGEERPIVSMGEVLGTYRKHNFGRIRFMLSQRRAERYAEGRASHAALVPGRPVYERLKARWDDERRAAARAGSEAARRRIDRRVLEIVAEHREGFKRQLRERGAEAMLAEPDGVAALAALGPDEFPAGFASRWRTGLWD